VACTVILGLLLGASAGSEKLCSGTTAKLSLLVEIWLRLRESACGLAYLRHSVHRSHAHNAFKTNELGITRYHRQPYSLLSVDIVYKLLVCIVPYSCMLTQLYNDLLGVKLANPNENLLRTLDTWQIFGTRQSYTGFRSVIFAVYMQRTSTPNL